MGEPAKDERKLALPGFMAADWKSPRVFLGAAVTLVVGLVVGHFLWTVREQVVTTKLLPPDTPPAEYLYLDTDRVLAYLGQIEGGLTQSETRIESNTQMQSGSLSAGLVADVTASAQTQNSVERVVTPAATDRFFTLVVKLRSGRETRNGRQVRWLHDLDARLTTQSSIDRLQKQLKLLAEGDFVRISNSRLTLPNYAAIIPKANYAAGYSAAVSSQRAKQRRLYAPISKKEGRDLVAYLRRLGDDPSLPFTVHATLGPGHHGPTVTFFLPVRYTALLQNPRLVSGNLTIVGKVIYKDPRLPGDRTCREAHQAGAPCSYFDRETLTTFGPALERAPASVLESLGLTRGTVPRRVRSSVTFGVPVLVVLPVAIYQ